VGVDMGGVGRTPPPGLSSGPDHPPKWMYGLR